MALLVDSDVHSLEQLLTRSLGMAHTFVVVPMELQREAGIPEGDHPRNWIPCRDGRRPACGEARHLANVLADAWCLRGEGHGGDHW